MIVFRQRLYREQVDSKTAQEGKRSGVVQKKPSGDWGIISYKKNPPTWWDANYDSKGCAEKALSAYHANKH